MCEWSSECAPGDPNCREKCQALISNNYAGGQYAFASADVVKLFDDVIKSIFDRPEDISINQQTVSRDITDKRIRNSYKICINDSVTSDCQLHINMSCQDKNLSLMSGKGEGEVILSNAVINYCPAKAHPVQ